MKKIALLSSHPIQYNAPLFRQISQSDKLDMKVFYTWSQRKESLFDRDFGKVVQWDIPIFEGYEYTFVDNKAKNPGIHRFMGLVNPTLIKEIKAYSPDAILIYGWNYSSHFKVMRHFKGRVPIYFRGDSTLLDEAKGIKTIARRLLLTWVYKYVDIAFYVGKHNKDYFLKHGLSEKQLVFAPHAIDNDRFKGEKGQYDAEVRAWRNELNVSEDEVLMLFVGKFEPKKNPLLILDAMEKHAPEKLKMVFVGNGTLEDELRKRARTLPQIQFIPFQNQSKIPGLLHSSDAMILPSQGPGETWGLIINEAMACKNAIIVSDRAGCFADLVKDNGAIFPSGDVEELIEAIKKVASNRQVAVQLGENSQREIQNWTYSHFVEAIENVMS